MNLRRSVLSTPGSDGYMIEKAARTEADEVALDLEDAVAPAEKGEAQEIVIEAYPYPPWIRIPSLVTSWEISEAYSFAYVASLIKSSLRIVLSAFGLRFHLFVDELCDHLLDL